MCQGIIAFDKETVLKFRQAFTYNEPLFRRCFERFTMVTDRLRNSDDEGKRLFENFLEYDKNNMCKPHFKKFNEQQIKVIRRFVSKLVLRLQDDETKTQLESIYC